LAHIGGNGVGHSDKSQDFGEQDKKRGGYAYSPKVAHSADYYYGKDEISIMFLLSED